MNTIADQAIEYHKTFATGALRLTMLLHGCKFEIETGMKMTRGPKCSTRIKKEFGLKGNPRAVYFGFLGLLVQHGIVTLKGEPEETKTEEAPTT